MDGSLDPSFGGSGAGEVTTDLGEAMTPRSASCSIPLAGSSLPGRRAPLACEANFALARYGAGGSLDTGFGSAGKITTDFGG